MSRCINMLTVFYGYDSIVCMKKYILLKELPFMLAGTVFEKQCKGREDCCVFGISYYNCVKHYDLVGFKEAENKILCSIIDNSAWVSEVIPYLDKSLSAADAVGEYDSGRCNRSQLIQFIEDY